ncbi:MAG TPA: class I SAM-dependent methyltransferase [bacterium]|nr:class I SAM-dependent methyltransferase [bacterium]
MNSYASDDVLKANIEVHKVEAPYYDALHPEERNFFERGRRRRALEAVRRALGRRGRRPRALDVACGTGKVSIMLAEAGFDVIAFDASLAMLRIARGKVRAMKLDVQPKLICADLFSFLAGCPQEFDLIVFCGALHHVPDVPEALRLASSRLAGGGVMLITHEPLKQTISSRLRYSFHRAIARLDESLYRLRIRSLPAEARCIDYSMSDFQRRFGGIDPAAVASALNSNGLSVISIEKYCSRRFGVFCALADVLVRSQNTFQIVARR